MNTSTLPRHTHSASCSGCPLCKSEFAALMRGQSPAVGRSAAGSPVFRATVSGSGGGGAQRSVKPPDGYATSLSNRHTADNTTGTEETGDVEQEVVAAAVANGETDGYKVALMIRKVKEGQ
jgi:hypothetical protein